MPDLSPAPTFAPPERRSYLAPILIALAALAIAAAIAIHFYPATTVNIAHVHTDVLQTHTVFKSQSQVLAPEQAQNILFLVETLRIDNQLRVPIFLDDYNLTFTNPDDAQLTAKAVSKDELANLQLSFPALVPLTAHPLLRETSIEPGKSAEGAVVFSLPIPQAMYEARKSAVIKVDLYHRPAIYQTIPITAKP